MSPSEPMRGPFLVLEPSSTDASRGIVGLAIDALADLAEKHALLFLRGATGA
jgi:hypothetical protein